MGQYAQQRIQDALRRSRSKRAAVPVQPTATVTTTATTIATTTTPVLPTHTQAPIQAQGDWRLLTVRLPADVHRFLKIESWEQKLPCWRILTNALKSQYPRMPTGMPDVKP